MSWISKRNLIIIIFVFLISLVLILLGSSYYEKSRVLDEKNSFYLLEDVENYYEYMKYYADADKYRVSGWFKIEDDVVEYFSSQWQLISLKGDPLFYVDKKSLDTRLNEGRFLNENDEDTWLRIISSGDKYGNYVVSLDFFTGQNDEMIKLKKTGLLLTTIGFIIFFLNLYIVIGFRSKKKACECQLGPPLQ